MVEPCRGTLARCRAAARKSALNHATASEETGRRVSQYSIIRTSIPCQKRVINSNTHESFSPERRRTIAIGADVCRVDSVRVIVEWIGVLQRNKQHAVARSCAGPIFIEIITVFGHRLW